MHRLPPPDTDARRAAALRRLAVLDTLPEQAYDDIVHLASQLCGTPIALVSLVDDDRQWFKARVGLAAAETPRDVSFCAHAISQQDPGRVFEVPDAAADRRFRANPLVTGDPGIRFYAGAPLVTEDGAAVGTLCVIDRRPRELTPEQAHTLKVLSRSVVAQMELRQQADALRLSEGRYRAVIDAALDAVVTTDRDGRVTGWNRQAETTFGWAAAEAVGRPLHELALPPAGRDGLRRLMEAGPAGGGRVELTALRRNGSAFPAEVAVVPLRTADGGAFGAFVRDISGGVRTPRPAVDGDALLGRCGGNVAFLETILGKFEAQARDALREIDARVGAGDAAGLARVAHALRGTGASLSAGGVEAAASRVEDLGRGGDLGGAESVLNGLRDEVRRCLDEVPLLLARARGASPAAAGK